MKMKLTVITMVMAASGICGLAQDIANPEDPGTTPVVVEPTPATAEETPSPTIIAEETPSPTIVQAREQAAPDSTPSSEEDTTVNSGSGDEPVPLIVIDDVPLTDALRNLARQSGLNFQFDPRVTATNQPNVSIRFENVTPQDALEAVLENHGLKLEREGRAKIGRITFKDPKAEEPLVSTIIQLKYSDPTNLTSIVKSTLSARSQVMADPRTSKLIITTTEKELEAVTNLISTLDLPTRQVLIEAKILETSHSPSTIKGINWSGTFEAQQLELGNNALAGTPATPGVPGTPGDPGTIGGILSDPKVLLNSAAGFSPSTAFLNADGVSAVFSFFNKDADTEVIATPRAVTLDNQVAQLSVTRAFPIFQITPGSANSPAGAQITYTNLGTILYVTPRIAADDNVALKVVPEVSNIDSKDTQTINGQVNIANVYAIRRMEANVMIPSGNTLVMGGLVSDNSTKSYTKVPVLGDIPGLGWFFRTKGKSRDKGNLLIFVTPTIVENTDFYENTTGRDFLKTRGTEKAEEVETAWDSAKPHDWTKAQ